MKQNLGMSTKVKISIGLLIVVSYTLISLSMIGWCEREYNNKRVQAGPRQGSR